MITKKESACDSTVESRHRLMMLQLPSGGGVALGTARSRSSAWACQGVQHTPLSALAGRGGGGGGRPSVRSQPIKFLLGGGGGRLTVDHS